MPKQQNSNKGLWGGVIFLSLIGLAFSIHLIYLHVKVYTDPAYKSVCAISEKLNCEVVALSKYSLFLNIPVAVWGLLAYLIFIGLAVVAIRSSKQEEGVHGLMFLGTTFAVVSSATLAYISHTKIGAMCPSCMVTYAVNPVIWIIVLALIKKDGFSIGSSIGSGFRLAGRNIPSLFIGAFVVLLLMLAYPKYWESAGPFQDRNIARGMDHGHAWLGAKKPKVTIVEYTDYQCPHCKIQHNKMRKLLRKYKNKLRIVHRHYPLDHNCHPKIKGPFHLYACLFARASYCAGKQGKFWPMNDILYKNGKELHTPSLLIKAAKGLRLKPKAFKACLDSDAANDAIAKDLQAGMKAGVRGTPHFFMNGKAYNQGHIPEKDIIAALENPTTKPPVTSVKRPVTSVKRTVAPAKRTVAPAKRTVAPAKRPVTPTKRTVAPAKRTVAPIKRPVTPAKH